MPSGKRLTRAQREEIVTDLATGLMVRTVAAIHHVSPTTICKYTSNVEVRTLLRLFRQLIGTGPKYLLTPKQVKQAWAKLLTPHDTHP